MRKEAEHVRGCSRDGTEILNCPICTQDTFEVDLASYSDDTHTIDICADCISDFEADTDIVIWDTDELNAEDLDTLANWIEEAERSRQNSASERNERNNGA